MGCLLNIKYAFPLCKSIARRWKKCLTAELLSFGKRFAIAFLIRLSSAEASGCQLPRVWTGSRQKTTFFERQRSPCFLCYPSKLMLRSKELSLALFSTYDGERGDETVTSNATSLPRIHMGILTSAGRDSSSSMMPRSSYVGRKQAAFAVLKISSRNML